VAGLLNPAKRQDLALQALAAGGLESAHLLLAGHGEDRAALERLARDLDVAERTHFLGWRDDLPALMAAADLVMVPSRWEGMPYVVMEAMAAEKPVVAAAVDGARDLVDDSTGALVPPEDPAALAAAAARLLAAGPLARSALGARGAERVARGHTIDTMVAGTRAVYAEVA
jgi:glycosyltransferase involved in cell wall biosynthesis